MLKNISDSYAGSKQCEIIHGIAEYMLSEYESGRMIDRISEKILRDAYRNKKASLHHLSHLIYKNDGITIAYAEQIGRAHV